MARFRKLPVEIEAVQWNGHGDYPMVGIPQTNTTRKCRVCGKPLGQHGTLDTLEGPHIICPDDWIITGVKGELYPCKPDIFDVTYEPVEEQ